MNKAFLKEPENLGGRCPRCEALGTAVPPVTLQTFLTAEQRSNIATTAYFCTFAGCPVVYFDDFERVVPRDQLAVAVWPKDADAPICPCFGLTAADVAADVAEGGVARVKAVVARSKTAEAACAVKSPTGICCAAEVQRYFFKLKSQPSR
jgi:hypothetical protein